MNPKSIDQVMTFAAKHRHTVNLTQHGIAQPVTLVCWRPIKKHKDGHTTRRNTARIEFPSGQRITVKTCFIAGPEGANA